MELEINSNFIDSENVIECGTTKILFTPAIGEDFWLFRVKLGNKQSILGFPKFMTIGIGFAKENDWNTNLPYSCETNNIFNHIKHNKDSKSIKDSDVKKAIKIVQDAAILYKNIWNNNFN